MKSASRLRVRNSLWLRLRSFQQAGLTLRSAFVSLTLTPALIFYLMAQKHIIAGLTAGAVKG